MKLELLRSLTPTLPILQEVLAAYADETQHDGEAGQDSRTRCWPAYVLLLQTRQAQTGDRHPRQAFRQGAPGQNIK